MSKWLFSLLLLLFLGLQYRLWLGEGNLPAVWALRADIQALKQQNAALEARNQALEAEVEDLKQGTSAIEERARSELGMVGRGETFFLLPEKKK